MNKDETHTLETKVVVYKSKNGHYAYPVVEAYIDGQRSPGWYVERNDTAPDGTPLAASVGNIGLTADKKAAIDQEIAEAMATAEVPVKIGLEKWKKEIRHAINALETAIKVDSAVQILATTFAPDAAFDATRKHLAAMDEAAKEALRNVPEIGPDQTWCLGDYPPLINGEGLPCSHLHRLIQDAAREYCVSRYIGMPAKFERPEPSPEVSPDDHSIWAEISRTSPEKKIRLALEEEFVDFIEAWHADSL